MRKHMKLLLALFFICQSAHTQPGYFDRVIIPVNELLYYDNYLGSDYRFDFDDDYPNEFFIGQIRFQSPAANAFYETKLMWGGLSNSVDEMENPLVGGGQYGDSTTPSWFTGGTHVAFGENDRVRQYRYRPAIEKVPDEELKEEAALSFRVSIDEVEDFMIADLRQRYKKDLWDWPAERGAPFADLNENSIYEPENGEHPEMYGADMVIWYARTDGSAQRVEDFFDCLPLGIEHQITVWAYANREGFENAVFQNHRLVYHGNARIDSFYVGMFLDPDVFYFRNDLIGCDTLLGLGYAYNGSASDSEFSLVGDIQAATGITLLQGPRVFDAAMTEINFPQGLNSFGIPHLFQGAPHFYEFYRNIVNYNWLKGLEYYERPRPYINPETGLPTLFPLSGDPVKGTGDIDQDEGDRVMLLSCGPVTLLPGYAVETTWALSGAISDALLPDNRLASITKLKYYSRIIKEQWQVPFEGIFTPPSPKPDLFLLEPNFPNPFNGATNIRFYIKEKSRVMLDVFNIVGQRIEVLFDDTANEGLQEITWQPESQPSGTYIIRLQAHGRKSYIKAVYIK